MRTVLLATLLCGCGPEPEPAVTDSGTGLVGSENLFPLPPDIDTIDWVSVFQDAVGMMKTVNTQSPWLGHQASLDTRQAGCPDFWTGEFEIANVVVGNEDGVSWSDDCLTGGGLYYDGWVWWDSTITESGDPGSNDGRTSDGFRQIEGDAVVGDDDGIRFEFDGEASDSFYRLQAYGYERFVYSTTLDATITGRDMFEGTLTPDGFRSDLFMYITGGDVDYFEARGNAYFFTPQLHGRFDSVQVDMALVGPTGASPTDCTAEPLGWIGVRDENAYWYDVVFLPRYEEDIVGEKYPNDPLSVCDGCGRLYIQGVEQQGKDVCIDFSFLFDGSFPLPDPDDYVLPLHAL